MPPRVTAGLLHRLGVAVNSVDEASTWFERTLGSFAMIPADEGGDDGSGLVEADGLRRSIMWLGSVPLLLLEPTDRESNVNRFLERQGPGIHSLAWEIDDMWATENRFRLSGIGITGTDVVDRHFFTHPRDTFGMLIEWTDTKIPQDPRTGVPLPTVPERLIDVDSLAWVTAVVHDVEAAATFLQDHIVASIVEGNPVGPPDVEDTLDLAIGDVVVRLVAPRSPASRYAGFLKGIGQRLCSTTLRVPDLADATERLEGAGIPVIWREPGLAGTDPAATLGLRLEWTE